MNQGLLRITPHSLAGILAALLFTCVYSEVASAVQLTVSPSVALQPNAPLTGLLDFSTDVPTRMSFRVRGPGESWVVSSSDFHTDHSIPVLGLAPDRQYTIDRLRLTTAGNEVLKVGGSLPVTTDPLPSPFPQRIVKTASPSEMEPGLTMFGLLGRTMAVDAEGTVRWYIPIEGQDVRMQPNGLLLSRVGSTIQEYNMLGEVQRGWRPTSNPGSNFPNSVFVTTTGPFHHDVYPMSNGNYATLMRSSKFIDDFPTSETDPNAPTDTVEIDYDTVLEFAPDGTIVHSWDLTEIIDPHRIGYGTLNHTPADWSHSNAVVHDESDDSFVVSVRHQDAVIKFSRTTGELKWILGNHDNWAPEFEPYLLTPVGDLDWQYHQHSPTYLPNGNLLVHDNGNFRASAFNSPVAESQNYTRSVEYAIDEENMEVSQVWEYGPDAEDVIYSRSRGDSDWMPLTDNVLTTFAHVAYVDHVAESPFNARIIETNRDGDVVFDLEVSRPTSNTFVYRSERIHSLYGGTEYLVLAVPEPNTLTMALLLSVPLVFSRRRRAVRTF